MSNREEHAYELIAQNLVELRRILEQQSNNNAVLCRIAQMEERIMATAAELTAQVKELTEQVKKSRVEVQGVQAAMNLALEKIASLEAIIAAGGVSAELVAAFEELKVAVQEVDNQIPDEVQPA